MTSGVDVLVANDVVLTEVAARLHFDQGQGHLAGVFHSVHRTQRDVDGLVLGDELNLLTDGYLGRAFDHDPMLSTVVMALQGQRRTLVDDDALYLKPLTNHQALLPAPGAVVSRQGFGLRHGFGFQHGDGLFDLLRAVLMGN